MKHKHIFIILIVALCYHNAWAQKQFKALLVTTTVGWHHESVHAGVLAIQQLGSEEQLRCGLNGESRFHYR